MPIINFVVPNSLNQKIIKIIKEQGFMSKAEFVRVAIINYINNLTDISQAEFEESARQLSETIRNKIKPEELPSLEEQMADLV